MPGKPDGHRLILCNDGGTLLGPTMDAPMGREGLAKLTIGPLLDTQVDTLYWQLGTDPYQSTPTHRLSDWYSHSTEIAPRWGTGQETFDSSGNWRIYENTRQLINEGTDPPAVVIEEGHKAGLQVFLSMRVNDIHDGNLDSNHHRLLSPMKRAHRDWLMGPASNRASEERYPGLSRFAYNFAVPEVREYKLALAREAISNYDLDGLDWDFCPPQRVFPVDEGEKNADLITDMLRSLREALDAKGADAGRKLLLSVRVPPTFDLAMAFGMDVRAWLEERLIDILVAGVVHNSMHRVPVEEFVEAARSTDTQVIAQNLGFFWFGRPQSARVLFGEPRVYSTEMCRAAAATYWAAGVDGIYLWNNHLIESNWDARYDHQPWKEIAEPKLLARLDKHYLVDKPQHWPTMTEELGAPPIPPGPLPVSLAKAGDVADVPIDVADDMEDAARDGALEDATLRLMIVNLSSLDSLEYELNGQLLNAASARIKYLYNDCWLDFDASWSLKQGWNRLRVVVTERNPHVHAPLNLESVEVIVRYKGSV